jgi:hypothetical protein
MDSGASNSCTSTQLNGQSAAANRARLFSLQLAVLRQGRTAAVAAFLTTGTSFIGDSMRDDTQPGPACPDFGKEIS